jgi:NAD(P)-dependent dehydrogenase (short-subunit alcohol dehydrogenase family)
MDLGLQGKRALVTGSTKGLGRAIVETLLAEGASVSICARNADEVAAAVKDLSSRGKVVGAAVDAADSAALREWVASSADQLGGIDIYVHNTSGKPARKIDGWINNFNIDLMALVHGVEAATSALADGEGGSVISIGTTATAEHFGPGSGSYSALKSAVTNWTLGQAQVLGARGIRCNVVSPGPIMVPGGDWDMIKNAMPPFYEATCGAHPGGRIGEASDVANAVVFLASAAAKHINGTNVTVDGGFLKRVDF